MEPNFVLKVLSAYIILSIINLYAEAFKRFIKSGKTRKSLWSWITIMVYILAFMAVGHTALSFSDWVFLPAMGVIGIRLYNGAARKTPLAHLHILFWIHIAFVGLCIARWYL